MRTLRFWLALCVTAAGAIPAAAAVSTTSDPSVATEIGTRIRWGATGFEASIFDSNPFGQSPTLNPIGTPVWSTGLGSPYHFQIKFDSATGALDLGVDFTQDGDFADSQEFISRSLFSGATTSYLGKTFNYLSISGNESGSTGRSTISNLVINGDSQTTLAPGGLFIESFYKDFASSTLASPIVIEGDITFLTPGTSQERPSWNFNFKGPADPEVVPEPGTLVAWLLLGTVGVGAYRWRKRRAT